jgi:hypothetical protein
MSVGTSEYFFRFLVTSPHLVSQKLSPFEPKSQKFGSWFPCSLKHPCRVLTNRYAANAIILPSLDMYSNLLPTDASAMLDHLTASYSNTNRSQFNKHWRGRYGSTEEEQAKIWASINPDPGADLEIESKKQATVPLRFKTFEGEIKVVDAKIGDTLLQVARQWDLPSMEGSCGGNLGTSPLSFPSRFSDLSPQCLLPHDYGNEAYS